MEKIWKIVVVSLLAFAMLAGCAKEESPDKPDGEDELKILAIVNGTLGDKSFFDSLNAGLAVLEARDKITVKVVETGFDETKWEPALLDASEEDWDIIVAGTWQMADYVSKVAEQFPEKKYIVFDTTVDYEGGKNSNVYSMEYKQNEGSYLAGAVAAKVSEKGIIGFVGGMDIPVINDFMLGYVDGAQYVNPDVKVAVSYIGNFSDTGKAKELGLAQINLGAEVIFAAASTAGNGALEAAKDNNVIMVGVDSDQAALYIESGDNTMANLIYTSVLKEVGNSVIRAVDLYLKNELPWGKSEVLGIKEGAIGIAKNEVYEKQVPAEVKALIVELEDKIKGGEITVKTAFGLTAEELNKARDSVKP